MGHNERRHGERRHEQRERAGRRLVDRISQNAATVAWLLDIRPWEFAWVADRRRMLAARIEEQNAALNAEFR